MLFINKPWNGAHVKFSTWGPVIVMNFGQRNGTSGTTFVIVYCSKLAQQSVRADPVVTSHALIRESRLGRISSFGYVTPICFAFCGVRPTSEKLLLPSARMPCAAHIAL